MCCSFHLLTTLTVNLTMMTRAWDTVLCLLNKQHVAQLAAIKYKLLTGSTEGCEETENGSLKWTTLCDHKTTAIIESSKHRTWLWEYCNFQGACESWGSFRWDSCLGTAQSPLITCFTQVCRIHCDIVLLVLPNSCAVVLCALCKQLI